MLTAKTQPACSCCQHTSCVNLHGVDCIDLVTHACYGAGAVYLVERGNCSFVDKYQAVLAAGGSGMVLYDDIPGECWAGECWVVVH